MVSQKCPLAVLRWRTELEVVEQEVAGWEVAAASIAPSSSTLKGGMATNTKVTVVNGVFVGMAILILAHPSRVSLHVAEGAVCALIKRYW